METARHVRRFTSTAVSESDSNKVSKDQRRVRYDFAVDLKYFQVQNKTLFEMLLMKDIVYNVKICASSFESGSDVCNVMHGDLDEEISQKLENVSRLKSNNEVNVWRLNADRVEECYFLWKQISSERMDLYICLMLNRLMWRANGDA